MKNKTESELVKFKSRVLRTYQRKDESLTAFEKRLNEKFYRFSIKYLRKNKLTHHKFNLKEQTPQEKRIITKHMRIRQKFKTGDFMSIRRLPKEKEKDYQKRLKEIKSNWGQGDSPMKGIYIYMGDYMRGKAKLSRDGKIITDRYTPDPFKPEETTKDIWLPVDTEKFVMDHKKFITDLVNKYKPNILIPVFGTGQGVGQEMTFETEKQIDMLCNRLNDYATKYGEEVLSYLTGFIIRYHYFWGEKIEIQ